MIHLVNELDGIETILAETRFKLADLIASKGKYISKELKIRDLRPDDTQLLIAEENDKRQKLKFLEKRGPKLLIMGLEEKDDEAEALEFALHVAPLPKRVKAACFYQIHRQTSKDEFELVYESRFQNPYDFALTFDIASILINNLQVDQPNFSCRMQLFEVQKKGQLDRDTATHVGTVHFKLSDLIDEGQDLNKMF